MKKNYWSLFAILTVAMLSIGFAACSNDENEIPGDDPTPQPEVVDVEPSPATITMFGKTAFTCSNAYHRTDTVIGRILHTFYFTAVDISKPWNISADYDQIAIHIETASNEELSLDTITDFTFWTKRKGGDLILKSDEPARIKFKKVNDLYSISVSDMAMYNKDYGKGDLAFTFCNTLQQFSDAEKTAASNGSYNLCFYNPIEQGAEFPGGNDMFFTWVSQNVKYPATAQEQGIQGRVVFSFVVGKDGLIDEVTVTRSPDPSLTKEVERLMKSSPRWRPAMQGGKFVRSQFNTGITFSLS